MLELTDAAITEAVSKTQNDGRDTIRIGVTSGGCVGFEYVFEFAEDVKKIWNNSFRYNEKGSDAYQMTE